MSKNRIETIAEPYIQKVLFNGKEHLKKILTPDSVSYQVHVSQTTHTLFYSKQSLRLKTKGFKILKQFYDFYCLESETKMLNAFHIVTLSRHLQSPYYLEHSGAGQFLHNRPLKLYVLDKQDFFELVLINGDLDIFANMKNS